MNGQVYRITESIHVATYRLCFSRGEWFHAGVVLGAALGSLEHVVCKKLDFSLWRNYNSYALVNQLTKYCLWRWNVLHKNHQLSRLDDEVRHRNFPTFRVEMKSERGCKNIKPYIFCLQTLPMIREIAINVRAKTRISLWFLIDILVPFHRSSKCPDG